MSFRIIPKTHEKNTRKEKDSLLKKIRYKMNHLNRERASSFTSKGSITLEAAAVIPIFFLAILSMVYLFEVIGTQVSIQSALHKVGKEMSEELCVPVLISDEEIEGRIVDSVGKERLEDSVVAQGSEGLSCTYSKINSITGEINLNVRYQIEIPVPFFRLPIRTCEERLRVKAWTGYVPGFDIPENDEWVYMTEHGVVYHKSLFCSYLELSIRSVTSDSIGEERNESGGRYYQCEKCSDILHGGTVYITDYGNRYHTSLNCAGLKRTVQVVPLYELQGIGGCSKCIY